MLTLSLPRGKPVLREVPSLLSIGKKGVAARSHCVTSAEPCACTSTAGHITHNDSKARWCKAPVQVAQVTVSEYRL